MVPMLANSWSTGILFGFLVAVLLLIMFRKNRSDSRKRPPGPRQWPLIGCLPFMAKYANPADAFAELGKKYGDIVSLKLGSIDAIVVSGLDTIRQILVTRAQLFDSRPGFQRFHMLFDNNKDNSMAFSDWSESLRRKREIIGHHTFPKTASTFFKNVNQVASKEIQEMVTSMTSSMAAEKSDTIFIKPFLTETSFKIFTKYFCNVEITDMNEAQAKEVMEAFDDVFQEVNSQCVGDLFPFLMPICGKGHLPKYGEIIRDFTIQHCVQPRLSLLKHRVRRSLPNIIQDEEGEDLDLSQLRIPQRNSIAQMENLDENNNLLTNGFIPSKPRLEQIDNLMDEFLVNIGKLEDMSLDNALFAFEDILGGHSAIANFLTTVTVYLAQNPSVQRKVREEVNRVVGPGNENTITLEHKLPYCESVVWESARSISSLLVPHVANQDTYIGDYPVQKGTVFFLNNVNLNFSPSHWEDPQEFKPERFLTDEGRILKPEHFLPFGTGRRSCLGFKMLQYISTLVIANLCSNFIIEQDNSSNSKLPSGHGTLAVPGKGYSLKLSKLD